MKCTQMFIVYAILIAMLDISLVLSTNTFSVEGSQVKIEFINLLAT